MPENDTPPALAVLVQQWLVAQQNLRVAQRALDRSVDALEQWCTNTDPAEAATRGARV